MTSDKLVDLSFQRRKKQIISQLDSIPPLPAAAQQVLSIVAENPKDTQLLEQVIAHDPSLSMELLKVANCAAYYPATPITTIHRAIVFLGFSEVRSIALSLSIAGIFKKKRSKTGFDRQAFWEHAIGVAMISRIIAMEIGAEEPEIYFTCGLLHDIGRLVLDICFPDKWKQILKMAQEEEIPLLEAERRAGYPHNVIGTWLVKSWRLPEIYLATILGHHLPIRHQHFNTDSAIIKLADALCHEMDLGLSKAPLCNRYAVGAFLGIDKKRLHQLEEELQKIGELAGIITEGWT